MSNEYFIKIPLISPTQKAMCVLTLDPRVVLILYTITDKLVCADYRIIHMDNNTTVTASYL